LKIPLTPDRGGAPDWANYRLVEYTFPAWLRAQRQSSPRAMKAARPPGSKNPYETNAKAESL